MKDKKGLNIRGRLTSYIKWPIYLSGLLAIITLATVRYNFQAAKILAIGTLIYVIVVVIIYQLHMKSIKESLMDFATNYGQVQKQLLKQFVMPYALLDENGKFLWQNEKFNALFSYQKLAYKSVSSLFPEITKDKLPVESDSVEVEFSHEDKEYRAVLNRIDMQNVDSGLIIEGSNFDGSLIALFLFDETTLKEYIRRNWEESLVTAIIYVDNYDEVLDSINDDVRKSMLAALVEKRINKYFSSVDAIVRKTDVDKYFVVMKRKGFDEILEDKFSILEEVKGTKATNEIVVTVSIGFGLGALTYQESSVYAKAAIDLALGRGGDQVVVKSPETIKYFGGKSQQMEKTTKVKSRVKAHALREIIDGKENVIVMGHARADMDALGASIGIYRVAKYLNKKCNIVINEVTSSIRAMLHEFTESENYEEGTVVNSTEAINLVTPNTVLIVVDTNKPSITECPELLKNCRTIVVLDHHRVGTERIENPILSYIEPYASSACELVAEILQYVGDDLKLKSIEADCMYAGVMIDTNNFVTKTGVRTFEAAAYLRRCGADVTRVRKLFRDKVEDYKAKAAAVSNAELYREEFALTVCNAEDLDSPMIIGAQAANELLNISSVKASFVFTQFHNKIYISARSIDEVNVQIVMERLGGGGHLNIAGAQIEDKTLGESMNMLKSILDSMIENQEI